MFGPGLLRRAAAMLEGMLKARALRLAAERESESLRREISRSVINQRAEKLLDSYGDSILRYAYSYMKSMDDAEEVLQDTLLQFLKSAPELGSREHEKAWLLRVAGNICKDRLRYISRHRTDELSEELAADEREDLAFVWEAVAGLPVKYREVIHLFYHEGYSTKQISEILGRAEPTVRSDLTRGRARLRQTLKEAYDFE